MQRHDGEEPDGDNLQHDSLNSINTPRKHAANELGAAHSNLDALSVVTCVGQGALAKGRPCSDMPQRHKDTAATQTTPQHTPRTHAQRSHSLPRKDRRTDRLRLRRLGGGRGLLGLGRFPLWLAAQRGRRRPERLQRHQRDDMRVDRTGLIISLGGRVRASSSSSSSSYAS